MLEVRIKLWIHIMTKNLDFGAKIFTNEDEIIRNSGALISVGMIDENKIYF